jgi:dTDP-4-dehydrorhamnose reductase
MKMLILGSTGMLGMAIYHQAQQEKIPVIGAARSGADRRLDIKDESALRALLVSERPSIVINTVAITNLDTCEKDPSSAYFTNTRPASIIAGTCREIGARFIHISTDHYYSGDARKQHTERDAVTIVNEYARTKYAAETFALTHDESLVIRTNIVGFRNRPGSPTFIEWCIRMLEEKSPATLFDDFFTSPIDVYGFADILLDLIDTDTTGILNVAGKDVSSKQEFILGLADALHLDASHTVTGSVKDLAGTRRAESLGLHVKKAEGILGYAMPDHHTVISHIVHQYTKEH